MVICPMPCHKPKAWGSVCGMIDHDMMAQYAKFAERLADAASVETLKRFRQQADVSRFGTRDLRCQLRRQGQPHFLKMGKNTVYLGVKTFFSR